MTLHLLTPETLTVLTHHNADPQTTYVDGRAAANYGVRHQVYRPWTFDTDFLVASLLYYGTPILPPALLNQRVRQFTSQQHGRYFFTNQTDNITQGCAQIAGVSNDAFHLRLAQARLAFKDLELTPKFPLDPVADVRYPQQLWLLCQLVADADRTTIQQSMTLLLGGPDAA